MDKYAIHIPELQLDVNQRLSMLHFYHVHLETHGKEYITSKGTPSGMFVVNEFEPSPLITALNQSVPNELFKESAFLSNRGIGQHRDATRQAVISFEIFNVDNIPMNVYIDNEVRPIIYMGRTFLWNPQVQHGVDPCKNLRIFYQIELLDTYPFEYYRDLYYAGQLLTSLIIN